MKHSLSTTSFKLVAAIVAPLVLSGCFASTSTHGYVVSPEAIDQVPVGSSKEQVELALGSPSTKEDFGTEGWYYISSKQRKVAEFAKPRVVERRVFAVYFDEEDIVAGVANYGLKDGKVFDYNRNVTATGGSDFGFLRQLLTSATQTDGRIFNR